MMKSAKNPDFPDVLPIHNIVHFPQNPPYRRQRRSGGQQPARSCGHSAPRAPGPHPRMPGAGRCQRGLGAASSTWCGWDTCLGSSWSSGCHCEVSAACGHSRFLQRHRGGGSDRVPCLSFPALVRSPEQPLGICSLFKCFPCAKHHFLLAFLGGPGTGNCLQGDPGMKLP